MERNGPTVGFCCYRIIDRSNTMLNGWFLQTIQLLTEVNPLQLATYTQTRQACLAFKLCLYYRYILKLWMKYMGWKRKHYRQKIVSTRESQFSTLCSGGKNPWAAPLLSTGLKTPEFFIQTVGYRSESYYIMWIFSLMWMYCIVSILMETLVHTIWKKREMFSRDHHLWQEGNKIPYCTIT